MSQILKAKKFASDAHAGDTYGEHDYTKHLNDVHNALSMAGVRDELTIVTAWLHDTIEDTHIRYEDILDHFGHQVAEIVYRVTDKRGKNRRERHEATYPEIAECPRATVVKWADRTANVLASQHNRPGHFAMYKKEHSYFKEILFKKFSDKVFDEAIEFFMNLLEELFEEGPLIEAAL